MGTLGTMGTLQLASLLMVALGWTVIGWAVALVWAALDRPIGVVQQT